MLKISLVLLAAALILLLICFGLLHLARQMFIVFAGVDDDETTD